MEFEWDVRKNEKNIQKHGIDFADAVLIFDGFVIECEDLRQDYGERRLRGIGCLGGQEIAVSYTLRDNRIRMISARRARKDERQKYRTLFPSYSS
jgi:uncharacterized DUF497 family protein